jgi:hypothetical protein
MRITQDNAIGFRQFSTEIFHMVVLQDTLNPCLVCGPHIWATETGLDSQKLGGLFQPPDLTTIQAAIIASSVVPLSYHQRPSLNPAISFNYLLYSFRPPICNRSSLLLFHPVFQ